MKKTVLLSLNAIIFIRRIIHEESSCAKLLRLNMIPVVSEAVREPDMSCG